MNDFLHTNCLIHIYLELFSLIYLFLDDRYFFSNTDLILSISIKVLNISTVNIFSYKLYFTIIDIFSELV